MSIPSSSLKITIAGASGFVGKHLIAAAPKTWKIKALSRGKARPSSGSVSWCQADLFSLESTLEALKDTDVAIYLVHSMLPSSRLFQGNFADADLLIADNFAHACAASGVKQIIYLGGLMPTEYVSKHLRSRQEVEEVFKSCGVPSTILRAGMVAGNGGSSFEILRNLVLNLPGMILPQWTQAKTQVIYIDDLVRVLTASVQNASFLNQTIDAVNGEPLNYESLIRETARALGRKLPLVRVPVHSTGFSKLWVSIFGQTDYALASPLIDSLLCELPQEPPISLIADQVKYRTFASMLAQILKQPQSRRTKVKQPQSERPNTVRSIQRLPASLTIDSDEIARLYEKWLPNTLWGLIRVKSNLNAGTVHFRLRGITHALLELKRIRSSGTDSERAKLQIVGGILSKRPHQGWLEFRQIANRRFTLVAINEFVPTLPWYIYRFTQAIMHRRTMLAFGSFLRRLTSQT